MQATEQSTSPSDWKRIHQSPFYFDGKPTHMIEVWQNSVTRERYYIPHYSRTGRSWAPYRSGGQRLAFKSYAGAANHIKSGSQPTKQ